MLKTLLFFVITAILFYFMANPYFYQYLNAVTKNKVPKQKAVMITALLFASLLVLVSGSLLNIKEGFFFEVSPNRPRCGKGLVGRPASFQYSSDADRYGDWNRQTYDIIDNCGDLKDKSPECVGRDGFLGPVINVGSTCYQNI